MAKIQPDRAAKPPAKYIIPYDQYCGAFVDANNSKIIKKSLILIVCSKFI